MERDIERVEEIYSAYERRDFEALLLSMLPDVQVEQSAELPWGGSYHGHAGARQFISALSKHLDSRVIIERLIDAGSEVVAVGRTVGKARQTNLEFDVPLVHVWSFRQGMVARFQSFLDNATMLAVLGR